jgi:Flp pilus assembly protein TadG
MHKCVHSSLRRGNLGDLGTAAVEFAITVPLLVVLAIGAADYGAMVAQSSTLAAYARAAAEYARGQLVSGSAVSTGATIKSRLSIPAAVTILFDPTSTTYVYCTCADTPGTHFSCPALDDLNPCLTGHGSDVRVLQYVSMPVTQSFSPIISYTPLPGFPSTLSNTMVVRVQ